MREADTRLHLADAELLIDRVHGAGDANLHARFGCRVDSDSAEQQRILKQYGVDKPVDYLWIYR